MTATIAVCLLVSCAMPAPQDRSAKSAESTKPAKSVRAELLAVLDQLHPFDATRLPFVRVKTAWLFDFPQEPQHGFLVRSKGNEFCVRFLDGYESTMTATPKGTPKEDRVAFERISLEQYVATQLEPPAGGAERPRVIPHRGGAVDPYFETVWLVRCCTQKGLRDAADRLWAGLPEKLVRTELAGTLETRLVYEFADRRYSFADLLARHRIWLRAFPKLSTKVEERAATLTKMLESPQPETEAERRVANLRNLFDFPDDGAWIGGGRVGPVGPDPEQPDRILEQIRELGMRAVPALIAAVDDESLTRCVAYHRRHFHADWVETVGKVVRRVLPQITGIDFKYEKNPAHLWRQWFAVYQKEGERAALHHVLNLKLEYASPTAADRLLAKFADSHATIVALIRSAGLDADLRAALVEVVAGHDRPETIAFLLSELRRSEDIEASMRAADFLTRLGRDDGLRFVLQRFQRTPRAEHVPLLLKSGDLAALRAVYDRIEHNRIRKAAWSVLSWTDLETLLARADGDDAERVERIVEDMLARMLRDDHRPGISISFSVGGESVSLHDPSRGELAACRMVNLWPGVYQFQTGGVRTQVARRIAEVRNTWRERRGLPKLAIADAPDIRSRDPKVRRLVAAIRERGTVTREETKQLEAFGLGALPWLVDLLDQLPDKSRLRSELAPIVRRLANTVREVVIDVEQQPLPEKLRKDLRGIRGRRIELADLNGLVRRATRASAGSPRSVEVYAERTGEDDGVYVRLRIRKLTKREEDEVGSSVDVRVGDERLGSAFIVDGNASDLRRGRDKIKRAFAADRSVPFMVRLTVIRN